MTSRTVAVAATAVAVVLAVIVAVLVVPRLIATDPPPTAPPPTDSSPSAEPSTSEAPPTTTAPSTGPTPEPSSPAASDLLPLAEMVVAPGQVGPITVGITKDEAAASGYFFVATEGACNSNAVTWKDPWGESLDTLYDADTITAIGISGEQPRTADGLGVGSTYLEVQRVVGGSPQANDYGQATLALEREGLWIGFAFETSGQEVADDAPVVFMEVTSGSRPGLLRDGC